VVTVAVKQASTNRTVTAPRPLASFCVTPAWQPPPAEAAGIPTMPTTATIVQSSIPRFTTDLMADPS
jgi:hypothetical protein